MSLSINDIFFLISSIGLFTILIYKLYNVMHKGDKAQISLVIITLILAILLKYVLLIGLLSSLESVLFIALSNLFNGLYILIWILFFIEIILNISNTIQKKKYKYTPTKPDYEQ